MRGDTSKKLGFPAPGAPGSSKMRFYDRFTFSKKLLKKFDANNFLPDAHYVFFRADQDSGLKKFIYFDQKLKNGHF